MNAPTPQLLRGVLDAVNLGAVVLDADARVVLWNAWMARHSGLAEADVVGADFFAVCPDLRGGRLAAALGQALRENFAAVLSHSLNKAPLALYADPAAAARGERLQQAIEVTPLAVAGAARHCLIQVSDVSIAVRRETLLREQAMVLRTQTFSDGLTGVANRRHFDVALEREHRRAKRAGAALSLLMIDIDHFKAYNDHHGHQKGDQCLIAVAAALASMLKRPCDLVARYGGEEFAVILPELDLEQAARVAETLRARVRALAIAQAPAAGGNGGARAGGGGDGAGAGDGAGVGAGGGAGAGDGAGDGAGGGAVAGAGGDGDAAAPVTVSVGVTAQRRGAPVGVEALIGAADRALYQAKHEGRDRVAAREP